METPHLLKTELIVPLLLLSFLSFLSFSIHSPKFTPLGVLGVVTVLTVLLLRQTKERWSSDLVYDRAIQSGKIVGGTVYASYPESTPGLGWII